MERVRRIELLSLAWKAKVLPLHNTRNMAERKGFEPSERLHVQHLSRVPLSTTQPPLYILGSDGRGRTYDQLINSQLLYH